MSTELTHFDELVSSITEFVAPIKSLTVRDGPSSASAAETLKQIKFWQKKIEEKRKELVGPLNTEVSRINDYAKTILLPMVEPEAHLKSQQLAYERLLEKEREEARRLEKIEQAKREEAARAVIAKQEAEARAAAAKVRAEAEEAARIARENAEALAMFEAPDEAEVIRAKAEHDAREAEQKAMFEARQLEAAAASEAARISFEAKKAHWEASKEIKENRIDGIRKTWKYRITDESLLPRDCLIPNEAVLRKRLAEKIPVPGVKYFQESSITVR